MQFSRKLTFYRISYKEQTKIRQKSRFIFYYLFIFHWGMLENQILAGFKNILAYKIFTTT